MSSDQWLQIDAVTECALRFGCERSNQRDGRPKRGCVRTDASRNGPRSANYDTRERATSRGPSRPSRTRWPSLRSARRSRRLDRRSHGRAHFDARSRPAERRAAGLAAVAHCRSVRHRRSRRCGHGRAATERARFPRGFGCARRFAPMIHETAIAICPPSAAIEFAATFFIARDNARALEDGSTGAGASEPSCRMKLDPTDSNSWRTALDLTWRKNTALLLPTFTGSLTARPAFVNSRLTLEGDYDPESASPRSPLDAIALEIARVAARSLLRAIVSYCETEWIRFAETCPTIDICNERSEASSAHRD